MAVGRLLRGAAAALGVPGLLQALTLLPPAAARVLCSVVLERCTLLCSLATHSRRCPPAAAAGAATANVRIRESGSSDKVRMDINAGEGCEGRCVALAGCFLGC